MKKGNYIKGIGISYRGRIEIIKKSGEKLQAIFEAFTNSLEAISLLERKKNNGQIKIQLFFSDIKEELFRNKKLEKIIIEDTGIGFNEENFNRLKNLDDNSKKFKNKGTGRIQFIKFFKEVEYESIYKNNNFFKKRNFILSMSEKFLDKNALILEKQNIKVDAKFSSTKLIMRELLDDKDIHSYYNNLDIKKLKEKIIDHYLEYFCSHRENLPTIKLELYCNDKLNNQTEIKLSDFPKIDKTENFNVHYSVIEIDGKIEKINNTENFQIKAFKINKKYKIKNAIKFTSKGETIEKKIKFNSLKHDEHIDEKNYLFLISGDYIDNKISDTRGGILNIPKKSVFKKDFEKQHAFFNKEEIILNDIEDKANEIILKMYHEINKRNNEKINKIKELKNLFLLNDEIIKHEKIKINDTEEKILESYYLIDAKIRAKQDANLKKQLEKIENLQPSKSGDDYSKKLEKEVNELVQSIPVQNKTALAQYIARRKIVLELFDKILNRKLKFQMENKRNIDENLLHNLIFQQSSNDPEKSDLWLINEDFIYFKGVSEQSLGNISIENEKIIKQNLTPEEDKYRLKQSGNANQSRLDILLFPKEEKCIIIEFKTPKINVSEHLNQINRYASLINNLTKEKFNFKTYYAYLIGENIDIDDIADNDSDFKYAHSLNFIFRPYKRIIGKFGNDHGSIYTEVIKYSTLLERAKNRNKIFMKKLGLV